jgi:hypothetical protein
MTCYNSELPIGPAGPTGPQGPQGEPATLPYTRSLFSFTVEKSTATLNHQINNLGGIISLLNAADWSFIFTRTGGDTIPGIVVGGQVNSIIDLSTTLPCVLNAAVGFIEIDTSITFTNPDGSALPDDGLIPITIYIDNYPNGWDV